MWGSASFILFLSVAFLSLIISQAAVIQCPTQDRQALIGFKAGITADKSRSLASWSSSNCCTWNGVKCDAKTGRVTALNLGNTGISGIISSSLGNLSSLQELDLNNNEMMGRLPASLGRLSSLTQLILYTNPSLTGPIPESFGNLSNLQTLYITSCSFTGPLPQSLGGMSSLRILRAAYNRITGPIPASVGLLSNLFTFDFGNNFLSGQIPDGFSRNLATLFFLFLNDNNITGLPADLSNLKSCQVVDLSSNDLILATITGLATLPKLGELNLRSNHLAGPFPSWVAKLQLAELSDEVTPTIDLSHNALTGNIPTGLGSVPNVVTLDLSNNALSGPIPTTLGNLPLQNLDLSVNKLSGSLPSAFSRLDGLKSFNVSYNQLSGKIPQTPPFTSFGASSYEGNPGLCGSPLPACKSR